MVELMETIFELEEENIESTSQDPTIRHSLNQELNANNESVKQGPQVGMDFPDLDSMYNFYQEHARLNGFSVTKKSAAKGKNDQRKYQTISCDKGRKIYDQKVSKRINCPAKISAIFQDNGTWKISNVSTIHNHVIDPSMSRFMPAHRKLTPSMKISLEARDIAGIRPCKSIRMLEVEAGGPENLSCLAKDCRNFIDQRRRFRLGDGDAEALRKLFKTMQQMDRNFYYAIDLDNDLRLRNVFWVHPRGRAAYEEFHDVVSFDTTYLVNRYKMPFATIVGINHHGQSILLGCALISNEDADTFIWLFRTWLTAMGGVHPNAILTDQCESIRKAIKEVMPTTRHRFCLWHILCKVPDKFRSLVDYDKAKNEFKALVYDSLSIQMFEDNWKNFKRKYGLEGNRWLSKLYTDREFWVPVYLKHIFWAGMLSTQRSESMHAFFDGYVNSMSTLKQFVDQYEIAIRDKTEKEFLADFHSKYKIIKCISDFKWEKQVQCSFTNSMFQKVQDEIKRLWYCHIAQQADQDMEQPERTPGIESIYILERSLINDFYVKEFMYRVTFRENGQYIECSCKKFESSGIICCHVMKVLTEKNIDLINERYLFRRWRKDVHRGYMKLLFTIGYPQMNDEFKRFKELEKCFSKISDLVFDDNSKLSLVNQHMEELKQELVNGNARGSACLVNNATTTNVQHNSTAVDDSGIIVCDPVVARSRGRPRGNRLRGGRETNRSRGRGRRNTSSQVGEDGSLVNQVSQNDEYAFDLNLYPE